MNKCVLVRRLILYLIALNLADGILTWINVSAGIAEELNPIMNWFLLQGPIIFFSAKLIPVSLLLLFAYKRMNVSSANKFWIAFVILSVIYSLIVALGLVGVVGIMILGGA